MWKLPKCGKYVGCKSSNGSLQSICNVFRWFVIDMHISGGEKNKGDFTLSLIIKSFILQLLLLS